ncbi:hypothetical protein NQ317_000030, partial [Molorchus minor]
MKGPPVPADPPIYFLKKDHLSEENRGDRKVGLILGIAGACRTDELVNLTVDDIEDVGSSLIVKIPNTKTKIPRIFCGLPIWENMLELFENTCPFVLPTSSISAFFCTTKQEK